LQIQPERNQVLATANFRKKGFFLTTRASAVNPFFSLFAALRAALITLRNPGLTLMHSSD
jgi:hypothetical protein